MKKAAAIVLSLIIGTLALGVAWKFYRFHEPYKRAEGDVQIVYALAEALNVYRQGAGVYPGEEEFRSMVRSHGRPLRYGEFMSGREKLVLKYSEKCFIKVSPKNGVAIVGEDIDTQ